MTMPDASDINDGAVAMIVASRKAGDAAGAEPLAHVVASGVAGVPSSRVIGIGSAKRRKTLARAGLSLSDIDVIEIDEAFAAQVLACLRGLDLAFDDSGSTNMAERLPSATRSARRGRACADRGAPTPAPPAAAMRW